jgi:hypothetical protein
MGDNIMTENENENEMVTITKREYLLLLKRDMILTHLEASGVDNWSDYTLPYCWECDKIPTDGYDYIDHPTQSWEQVILCSSCKEERDNA